MRTSNLSNHFVLVGPPQVVHNSKLSDTATAYFKVWDSQRGTRAANLIGHSLQFGHWTSRVMEASANPGASLCQHCWHWGHSSQTCHQKMPQNPTRSSGGVIGDVRVFLQNVNCNYMHVDYVFEALKDTYDILFFQEPCWRMIRQTVSTTSVEGDDVVGAPKHPDWLYMVRPPTNGQNSHVMAYVHRHLAVLHPSMRRDIIDHHDLLVLLLFTPHGMVNLLNIYSDDAHMAINLLAQDVDQLPAFIYMGGDFNCHLEVWDSSCTLHPLVAQCLLELERSLAWPEYYHWDFVGAYRSDGKPLPPVTLLTPESVPLATALNKIITTAFKNPPFKRCYLNGIYTCTIHRNIGTSIANGWNLIADEDEDKDEEWHHHILDQTGISLASHIIHAVLNDTYTRRLENPLVQQLRIAHNSQTTIDVSTLLEPTTAPTIVESSSSSSDATSSQRQS
ncbi:hypothetical protein AN958_02146 [Leucoagaricus sp. SymC.cos]|nr:hypothetical protein AN958_02146 [Leucoagaricus sp. SymC.cos]